MFCTVPDKVLTTQRWLPASKALWQTAVFDSLFFFIFYIYIYYFFWLASIPFEALNKAETMVFEGRISGLAAWLCHMVHVPSLARWMSNNDHRLSSHQCTVDGGGGGVRGGWGWWSFSPTWAWKTNSMFAPWHSIHAAAVGLANAKMTYQWASRSNSTLLVCYSHKTEYTNSPIYRLKMHLNIKTYNCGHKIEKGDKTTQVQDINGMNGYWISFIFH